MTYKPNTVVGPASATNTDIAIFSGTTGKIIADGSSTVAAINGDVVGPASSVDDRIATFDGTTGKLIQDSGSLISDISGWTSFTVNNETSTSYTLVAADEGADVINCYTGTADATWTLRAAATMTAGAVVRILNKVAYTLTVEGNGSETISGELNTQLLQYDSVTLYCDGTNVFVI